MLKISNLSKTYPNGVEALKTVSLDIPAGMYGLLGPVRRQTNGTDVAII
jgi:ABC-2 type transport system ATP-binding protein